MESKVLLIDDDSMTNYLHKRVISNAGMASSIIVSTNGKEGIEELLKIEEFRNKAFEILKEHNCEHYV